MKFLHIRLHNSFVDRLRFAGGKGEYIDSNVEKLHDEIRDSQDEENIAAVDKRANEYLAGVRAKHG